MKYGIIVAGLETHVFSGVELDQCIRGLLKRGILVGDIEIKVLPSS